ncbi:hypothetical protein HK105_200160 [Polyrhizophydium stewartii]|uniref:G protein-coupled receptor n=1 Tax=Polyrhizophydium stewartii TaxID=2732419 RepID=A0ABR4NKN3_9FUNG
MCSGIGTCAPQGFCYCPKIRVHSWWRPSADDCRSSLAVFDWSWLPYQASWVSIFFLGFLFVAYMTILTFYRNDWHLGGMRHICLCIISTALFVRLLFFAIDPYSVYKIVSPIVTRPLFASFYWLYATAYLSMALHWADMCRTALSLRPTSTLRLTQLGVAATTITFIVFEAFLCEKQSRGIRASNVYISDIIGMSAFMAIGFVLFLYYGSMFLRHIKTLRRDKKGRRDRLISKIRVMTYGPAIAGIVCPITFGIKIRFMVGDPILFLIFESVCNFIEVLGVALFLYGILLKIPRGALVGPGLPTCRTMPAILRRTKRSAAARLVLALLIGGATAAALAVPALAAAIGTESAGHQHIPEDRLVAFEGRPAPPRGDDGVGDDDGRRNHTTRTPRRHSTGVGGRSRTHTGTVRTADGAASTTLAPAASHVPAPKASPHEAPGLDEPAEAPASPPERALDAPAAGHGARVQDARTPPQAARCPNDCWGSGICRPDGQCQCTVAIFNTKSIDCGPPVLELGYAWGSFQLSWAIVYCLGFVFLTYANANTFRVNEGRLSGLRHLCLCLINAAAFTRVVQYTIDPFSFYGYFPILVVLNLRSLFYFFCLLPYTIMGLHWAAIYQSTALLSDRRLMGYTRIGTAFFLVIATAVQIAATVMIAYGADSILIMSTSLICSAFNLLLGVPIYMYFGSKLIEQVQMSRLHKNSKGNALVSKVRIMAYGPVFGTMACFVAHLATLDYLGPRGILYTLIGNSLANFSEVLLIAIFLFGIINGTCGEDGECQCDVDPLTVLRTRDCRSPIIEIGYAWPFFQASWAFVYVLGFIFCTHQNVEMFRRNDGKLAGLRHVCVGLINFAAFSRMVYFCIDPYSIYGFIPLALSRLPDKAFYFFSVLAYSLMGLHWVELCSRQPLPARFVRTGGILILVLFVFSSFTLFMCEFWDGLAIFDIVFYVERTLILVLIVFVVFTYWYYGSVLIKKLKGLHRSDRRLREQMITKIRTMMYGPSISLLIATTLEVVCSRYLTYSAVRYILADSIINFAEVIFAAVFVYGILVSPSPSAAKRQLEGKKSSWRRLSRRREKHTKSRVSSQSSNEVKWQASS